MAHAIEGYSRARAGQTIPVKQQKKSVPVQTVKKPTNYTQAAVYTASGAKNTKSTATTYTAKATYADPVLAKKQSAYMDVAKSNQEAAKVSSDVLSKAKNFWNGVVEAGKSTIESVKDMVRHPVQMGKDLVYAAAHPKETAEGLKVMAAEVWQKYQTGNGDTKSHITGRVTGEIGLLFVGGWSKTGKVAKTSKAAEAVKAAEVVKAVDVAGDLVKGAKVAEKADVVVKAAASGKWVKVNESMSDFSRMYQHHVTGKVGEVWLQNGVKFDGIKDGVLLEAKGKYGQFVDKRTGKFSEWFTGKQPLIDEANRQINAAQGLPIQWHFAEESSMNAMKALIKNKEIKGIQFVFNPLKE